MIDDSQINLPPVVAEVEAVCDRYEEALVGNDIEVLDALFWSSPGTVRFGATENLWGADEIAAFRRQRSPVGLARRVLRRSIQTFGRDLATASIEFERNAQPGRIGRQQQTWVRTAQGWRVVAAHVSVIDRPG